MHDNVLSIDASSSLTSPREDNTPDKGQQPTMPLGVEPTGDRLLTTGVILSFGVPKAAYSHNGQSLICIDVVLRLFWLGVIEAKRPELSPCFFQADLTPPILRFLCCPEGACCGYW